MSNSKHYEEYQQTPQVVVRVPGIIKFLGAFAENYKGYALCAADSRELKVTMSVRSDSQIRVYNTELNDRKHFSSTAIKFRKEDRWSNYVKGILLELSSLLPAKGLNITLDGSLLNSDNRILCPAVSLAVGIAACKISNVEVQHNRLLNDIFNACNNFCGERVEYMTILTMMNARENRFIFFDNQEVNYSYLENTFPGSDYKLYLIDSKIPPAALNEELDLVYDTIIEAMGNLRKSFSQNSFKNISISDLEDRITPMPEESRRVCTYLLEEYKSTSSLDRLIKNRDFEMLGRVFNRVEKGIRNNLELTCPELDWLVKRCSEISTCAGACVVFTGRGGVIAAIVKEGGAEQIQSRLEEYERIFGFRPTFLEFVPEGSINIR
ncbi:MAG: hypothetical protein K6F82_06510 [Sphaerochaetaceae bacterium]|nr:hypothetical protein [Sphaerochaetaceae bacterium]